MLWISFLSIFTTPESNRLSALDLDPNQKYCRIAICETLLETSSVPNTKGNQSGNCTRSERKRWSHNLKS